MSRLKWILGVTLLAAAGAAVAIAVRRAREIEEVANETADDIEAQLDALDPATRAAVVGRLTSDVVDEVKAAQS